MKLRKSRIIPIHSSSSEEQTDAHDGDQLSLDKNNIESVISALELAGKILITTASVIAIFTKEDEEDPWII